MKHLEYIILQHLVTLIESLCVCLCGGGMRGGAPNDISKVRVAGWCIKK